MATQSATSAVIFGAGDVIAQQLVDRRGLRNHDVSNISLNRVVEAYQKMHTAYQNRTICFLRGCAKLMACSQALNKSDLVADLMHSWPTSL